MDLDYPKETLDGQTERSVANKALENVKLKPKMREELEEKLKLPDIPEEYYVVWEAFWDLYVGGEKIAYSDILSYCLLFSIQFTASELEALRIMDSTANAFVEKEMKKQRNKPHPTKGA
jgi:hypothetical protein